MATEQAVSAVIVATRPQLRNDPDRVVFALHACFLSAGYVLNATGVLAFLDNAVASTSSDEVGMQGWNDYDDYYAFVYGKHERGCKKVLVKCVVVNDKLMIDVLEDGSSDPHHLEINIGNFIGDSNASNYMFQYKNLGNLVSRFNKEVLTKLTGFSTSSSSTEPNRTRVLPVYPDVGDYDRYPFGVPGTFPSRGNIGNRGMHIGPNDSIFHREMDYKFDILRPVRFENGGVPPRARFHSHIPFDVSRFDPNRSGRNLRRHGGGDHQNTIHFGDDFDYK